MEKVLPGTLLRSLPVYGLKIGTKIYDKKSNRLGVVSSVKETAPEWIEAFIKFHSDDKEVPAYKYPECVVIGDSDEV